MPDTRQIRVKEFLVKFTRLFNKWKTGPSDDILEALRYPGDIEYLMLLNAGQVYRITSEDETDHLAPVHTLMGQPEEKLRGLLLAACNYIETKHIIESVHEIARTSATSETKGCEDLRQILALELDDVLLLRDRLEVVLWAVRMIGWPLMVKKEDFELSLAYGRAGQKAVALDEALKRYPVMTLAAMQIFAGWRTILKTPLWEGVTEWWLEDPEPALEEIEASTQRQLQTAAARSEPATCNTSQRNYAKTQQMVDSVFPETIRDFNREQQTFLDAEHEKHVLAAAEGGQSVTSSSRFTITVLSIEIVVEAEILKPPPVLRLTFRDKTPGTAGCPKVLEEAQVIVESPSGEPLFRGPIDSNGQITIGDDSGLLWARLRLVDAQDNEIFAASFLTDSGPTP